MGETERSGDGRKRKISELNKSVLGKRESQWSRDEIEVRGSIWKYKDEGKKRNVTKQEKKEEKCQWIEEIEVKEKKRVSGVEMKERRGLKLEDI